VKHVLTKHVVFDIVQYVADQSQVIVVEVVEQLNLHLKNQENVIANVMNENHENLDEVEILH
jgi:hypothetical protein